MQTVATVMTPEVSSVDRDFPLLKAIAIMAKRAISCVVVREGSRPFGPLQPRQQEEVARVQRTSSQLVDLVNAAFELIQLEAGRVSVACNPIDVEALFEQLGREFRALVPEGVSLHWRNELGTQPILGDHAKLKASLKNVVDNALKFTTAGRVEVMAAWADGLLTFVVQDTGIGIPAADLSHIFELFRQVDASDTRRFAGVGLGLHVVKRLLDVLG